MACKKVTKASVQFREEQAPLVRVKLPVVVLGAPLFAGCTVGGAPHELALHLGSSFASGPSLRFTYRPIQPAVSTGSSMSTMLDPGEGEEDESRLALSLGGTSAGAGAGVGASRSGAVLQSGPPLSLLSTHHPALLAVVKAGLGRWGGAAGAAVSVKLELDIGSPSRSRLLFKVEPRIGDFGLRHFPVFEASASTSWQGPLTTPLPATALLPRGLVSRAPVLSTSSSAPAALSSPQSLPVPSPLTREQLTFGTLDTPVMNGNGHASPQGREQKGKAPSTSSPSTSLSSSSMNGLATLPPIASAATLTQTSPGASLSASPSTAVGPTTSLAPAELEPAGPAGSASALQAAVVAPAAPELSVAGGERAESVHGVGASRLMQHGSIRVKRGWEWLQQARRTQGWDVAVHSAVPLGPSGTASARWRLRLPGDVLPHARAQLAGGPSAGGSSGLGHALQGSASVPGAEGGGAGGGLSVTLSERPMLMLDKLSVEFWDYSSAQEGDPACDSRAPAHAGPSSSLSSSFSRPPPSYSRATGLGSGAAADAGSMPDFNWGTPECGEFSSSFAEKAGSQGRVGRGTRSATRGGSHGGQTPSNGAAKEVDGVGKDEGPGQQGPDSHKKEPVVEHTGKETSSSSSSGGGGGFLFWGRKKKQEGKGPSPAEQKTPADTAHSSASKGSGLGGWDSSSSSSSGPGKGSSGGVESSGQAQEGGLLGLHEMPWEVGITPEEAGEAAAGRAPKGRRAAKHSSSSSSRGGAGGEERGSGPGPKARDVSEELRLAILQAKGMQGGTGVAAASRNY